MSQQPPVRILLVSLNSSDSEHIQEQLACTNVESDIHYVTSLSELSEQGGVPCQCDSYDAIFLDNTLANGEGVVNVRNTRKTLCRDVVLIVHTDDANALDIRAYYEAGADEILERGSGVFQLLSAMIKSQRITSSRRKRAKWAHKQSSFIQDISSRLDSALSRRRELTPEEQSAVLDA